MDSLEKPWEYIDRKRKEASRTAARERQLAAAQERQETAAQERREAARVSSEEQLIVDGLEDASIRAVIAEEDEYADTNFASHFVPVEKEIVRSIAAHRRNDREAAKKCGKLRELEEGAFASQQYARDEQIQQSLMADYRQRLREAVVAPRYQGRTVRDFAIAKRKWFARVGIPPEDLDHVFGYIDDTQGELTNIVQEAIMDELIKFRLRHPGDVTDQVPNIMASDYFKSCRRYWDSHHDVNQVEEEDSDDELVDEMTDQGYDDEKNKEKGKMSRWDIDQEDYGCVVCTQQFYDPEDEAYNVLPNKRDIDADNAVVWCSKCGRNIHRQCFTTAGKWRRRRGHVPQCPQCRASSRFMRNYDNRKMYTNRGKLVKPDTYTGEKDGLSPTDVARPFIPKGWVYKSKADKEKEKHEEKHKDEAPSTDPVVKVEPAELEVPETRDLDGGEEASGQDSDEEGNDDKEADDDDMSDGDVQAKKKKPKRETNEADEDTEQSHDEEEEAEQSHDEEEEESEEDQPSGDESTDDDVQPEESTRRQKRQGIRPHFRFAGGSRSG